MVNTVEAVARCSPDEIDRLRRGMKLARPEGGWRGVAAPARADAADERAIEEARDDILSVIERGVRIATQAECVPLIPLIEAGKQELPPALKVEQARGYDFYHVQVVFSVLLQPGEFPTRAEFALKIDDEVPSERRARAVQLFPEHKSRDYFRATMLGELGVDGNLEFAVALPTSAPSPSGSVKADAAVKASLVLGPYEFRFRRAAVEVRGVGDDTVEWAYNLDDELEGTNDFKSFLILKVPREATRVALRAALGVRPSKRSWLVFSKHLPVLRDRADLLLELGT
jgi:hypothetical protein